MTTKKLAIAVDHGGITLKAAAVAEAENAGWTVVDLGTDSDESVDYPDYAEKLVETMRRGDTSRGILICGTGIGISIAANRHPGIRAALCHDELTATMAREHNDANVLCMGGRNTEEVMARAMIRIFLSTPFEGGRHVRRVAKLG